MKKLVFVFFLFVSINALALNSDTARIRYGASIEKTPPPIKPLFVLDGVILKEIPKKMNTSTIINISVLKGAAAIALYGQKGSAGVILITTKKTAIKEYQSTLSEFSAQYRNYLEKNGGDSKLTYIINGEFLPNDKKVDKLFHLFTVPIKSLVFINNNKVAITTIKNDK